MALIKVRSLPNSILALTCTGRALITRLLHIANLILRSPKPSPRSLGLAREALIHSLPHIKLTWDWRLYTQVCEMISTTLHPELLKAAPDAMEVEVPTPSADNGPGGSGSEYEGVVDTEWVEEIKEAERKEVARMDVELRGYMSNLIKESIRVSPLPG
jgi:COP9 signalosome complex subunit 1